MTLKKVIVFPLVCSVLLIAIGAIQMIHLHELDLRLYAIWPFNLQLTSILAKALLSLYFVTAVLVWQSPKTSAILLVIAITIWFSDLLIGAEASTWQLGSMFVGEPMNWVLNLLPIACFLILAYKLIRYKPMYKLPKVLVGLLIFVALLAPHAIYYEPDALGKPDFNTSFSNEDHAALTEHFNSKPQIFIILSAGCGHCVQLSRALAIKFAINPAEHVTAYVRGNDDEIEYFKQLTSWPENQPLHKLSFNVPSSVMNGRFPAIGVWNGHKLTSRFSGTSINYWVIDHIETLGEIE